jgi:sulfate adenylyltransferase subunit 2
MASFPKPVMLYFIGKDSSVLPHLLRKALSPRDRQFPLLRASTTWKFREMITFCEEVSAASDIEVLVDINDGVRQGVSLLIHGAPMHTDVMKTAALEQALDKYGFDAAIGGA